VVEDGGRNLNPRRELFFFIFLKWWGKLYCYLQRSVATIQRNGGGFQVLKTKGECVIGQKECDSNNSKIIIIIQAQIQSFDGNERIKQSTQARRTGNKEDETQSVRKGGW